MSENSTFNLAYGTSRCALGLPAHSRKLQLQEVQKLITAELFQQRLEDFLRKNSLDLSHPVLVLADKTRLCGYPEYLPLLIELLQEYGMDAAGLKIIIGYGTHPRQSDEECLRGYGESYNRYSFIHHDCLQQDNFKQVGQTTKGTPIRFRRDLLEASAIITMGAVSHHYFAGFGGGRKLIFPGCGEREAIYTNHGLYLDRPAGILARGCQPGTIDGNPLAEDLFEVEEKLPADLAIHGILDSQGTLCDLLVGCGREDFLYACKRHAKNCEIDAPQFDTVLASCGGYPKDINFIQSHKAIHNSAMFVRDGGTLLLYGECREGIGSKTFLPWFLLGSFNAAFEKLSRNYEGNGGTALAMMTKLQRIRIVMVTSLDDKTCLLIGMERWSHDRVKTFLQNHPKDMTIAFIPNASLSVKKS